MSIIIHAEAVTRTYIMGAEEVHALRGITLDIEKGEYLSIMGPSGSGKSTFFNIVGGLDRPTTGEVVLEGIRYSELSASRMAWLRCHKIGYIFQTFNLIPTMTALENTAIARIFAVHDPVQARCDAVEALERVGLGHRLNHLPSQLSGGQQQRVAIARAIVNKSSIILADEPTGNLDLKTGEEIINLLAEMKKNLGITVITATHDIKMLSASDRVVWISDGAVKRVSKRSEISLEVGTIDGNTLA